jgi:hypothetical protein
MGVMVVGFGGNESDMARVTRQLESAEAEEKADLIRLRPEIEGCAQPLNASILTHGLKYFVKENVRSDGSPRSITQYSQFESHYIEQRPMKNRNPQEMHGTIRQG